MTVSKARMETSRRLPKMLKGHVRRTKGPRSGLPRHRTFSPGASWASRLATLALLARADCVRTVVRGWGMRIADCGLRTLATLSGYFPLLEVIGEVAGIVAHAAVGADGYDSVHDFVEEVAVMRDG